MLKFIPNSLRLAPAKKSLPARRIAVRGRLECLESRCMFAAAPLGGDYFAPAEVLEKSDIIHVGGDRAIDLGLPEFELPPLVEEPPRGEHSIPDVSPIPSLDEKPGSGEQQETLPPHPDENPSDDDSDSGGMIDLGNNYGGSDETSPTDSPNDGPTQRETRAVLEMLSALKYPLTRWENARSSLLDDLSALEHDQRLSNDAELSLHEAVTDGGAVPIAIEEIVAEIETERMAAQETAESLLDVSVQMDNTFGRFQAFEILTAEEAVPATESEANPTEENSALPFDDFGFVVDDGSEELVSDNNGSLLVEPEALANGIVLSKSIPPPVVAIMSEQDSRWATTLALATAGIVVQLLIERRIERFRWRARLLWNNLVHGTRMLCCRLFFAEPRRDNTPSK